MNKVELKQLIKEEILKIKLHEGKESLPQIRQLKQTRAKLQTNIDKTLKQINTLETSLEPFISKDTIDADSRIKIRKILNKIQPLEDKLETLQSDKSNANDKLKDLLGLK